MDIRIFTTLERFDYIKHYLGAPATVQENGKVLKGHVECIDSEDETIDFVYGILDKRIHRSFYPDHVRLNLKGWEDFGKNDLISLVTACKVNGEILDPRKFCIEPKESTFYKLSSMAVNGLVMVIRPNWSILCYYEGEETFPFCIDNYPEVVFLLCKMGYDVTGYFQNQTNEIDPILGTNLPL